MRMITVSSGLITTQASLPKSSYYYWQAHREPPVTRQHLQVRVQAIHAQVNQTYGSRRMSDALKADGLAVGRHQAGTLMREVGAVAVRPKKRHVYPKAGESVARGGEAVADCRQPPEP